MLFDEMEMALADVELAIDDFRDRWMEQDRARAIQKVKNLQSVLETLERPRVPVVARTLRPHGV